MEYLFIVILLLISASLLLWGMSNRKPRVKPPTDRQLMFIEKLREERDADEYEDWEPQDIDDASALIETLLECPKRGYDY